MIVLSDLDGTLLNHDDYAYDAAKPALEALREHHISLILCSSKTSAEIIPLRSEMGFDNCPAIVENGGGILKARATNIASSSNHKRLMKVIDTLPEPSRLLFSGISSWPPETLQKYTGLSAGVFSLAIQRQYSEPGLWSGDERSKQTFISALKVKGVVAHQGGRFLTLSFDTNKAVLAQKIIADYQSEQTELLTIVAFGDAPNDVEMLELADIGIIIPNPAHNGIPTLAGESKGQIIRANEPGAAGWNSTLLTILNNSKYQNKT
ncbi:MAG: mannosyl-3-phosphoglycerate phosphatase [Chitinophagales bacterium]|jgi:mannosyl-3-phosphoglycerate phosphatase